MSISTPQDFKTGVSNWIFSMAGLALYFSTGQAVEESRADASCSTLQAKTACGGQANFILMVVSIYSKMDGEHFN